MIVSPIKIDETSPSNEEWRAVMSEKLRSASRFEIHCWKEEQKEIEMALRFGRKKQTDWGFGTVIEGAVTEELINFLLTLPKPDDKDIYNKMTPFFQYFSG